VPCRVPVPVMPEPPHRFSLVSLVAIIAWRPLRCCCRKRVELAAVVRPVQQPGNARRHPDGVLSVRCARQRLGARRRSVGPTPPDVEQAPQPTQSPPPYFEYPCYPPHVPRWCRAQAIADKSAALRRTHVHGLLEHRRSLVGPGAPLLLFSVCSPFCPPLVKWREIHKFGALALDRVTRGSAARRRDARPAGGEAGGARRVGCSC
jgi:hypothetical protein